MPVYEYTALDGAGKRVRGVIDADSPTGARRKLRGTGMFPVTVDPAAAGALRGHPSASALFRPGGRIKAGEIAVMTRQVATLLAAGIPLVGVLEAVISQLANPSMKKVLVQVKDAVTEGSSLAHALSLHPGVFSEVYIHMVRAGEAAGSLNAVMQRLADAGEQAEALRGRLRAALAYPIFMFAVGSLILVFLITVIVPDIADIFAEMDQALPLPTRALIAAAGFLASFWWIFLLAVPSCVLLWRLIRRSPGGAYALDKLKLTFPLIGPVNRKLALVRFGRALGGMLHGGVSLLQALDIVRNVVDNSTVTEALDAALVEIRAGKNLSSQLSGSRWFSPVAVQMIAVGEQSGELDDMLGKMAEITEAEVESRITALTALLEPVMILFMGLLVGFIVVSILLPLFEMNRLVR